MNQIIKRINQALIVQINDKWWTIIHTIQMFSFRWNLLRMEYLPCTIVPSYIVPCCSQFAYNIFCVYIAAFFPQLLFISICAVEIEIVSRNYRSQRIFNFGDAIIFGEKMVLWSHPNVSSIFLVRFSSSTIKWRF